MTDPCPECGHTEKEHVDGAFDTLGCVGDRYPGVKISGSHFRCACQWRATDD